MKRKIAASVAVGMSVMMGVTPAFAANGTSNSEVYKEETVYVNAKASGKTDKVTVSNWLKNSGSVSGDLEDESTLSDIKNVKGDETFKASGDTLTWNTDGEDIYYQGTTDQDLPVSVKLTYYLDGKEIKDFPTTVELERCKPILKTLPAWKCDIRGIKKYEDLPENCRKYIEFVEEKIGFPITMISNGPGRDDIIYRNK